MRRALLSAASIAVVSLPGVGPAIAGPAQPASKTRSPGTAVAATPLRHGLWIPGTTSRAFKLTYVTTDARGRRTLSTGTVFLPKGRAPRGGWPVISWAHGTSGLGDRCAPSVVGPALPQRDRPYLANWMREGYAIVASDYAGLGTPGLPAYLNGRSEAHNIVDIVKAGRAYVNSHEPAASRLARKWVVIGQSQGAGAAIYTARYATQFGGPGLDYRGAVGTGTPAGIEVVVGDLGPDFPTLSPATTEYLAYILASLRSAYPELGIDGVLTATGRKYVKLAETACANEFEGELRGVNFGHFFSRPLKDLPGLTRIVDAYMKMPENGFDRPFFMGHGLKDTDVPYVLTSHYAATLEANHQPVTFKTYDADHSGTLIASQKDTHPFVRRLFAAG
jgi:hypothetical protein